MADKLIQVGNNVVAFPDTMSDDEIGNILSGKTNPEPQQRSFGQEVARQAGLAGRAIVTGITSLPMAVGDVLAHSQNLANQLTGREARVQVPSESFQAQLTQAGVPVPQNTAERTAQAGMQAMTGTAAMAKQVPVSVANAAKEVPIAGVSAALSQPAAEVVKDYTGSDLAATMAAIGVGGVTAGYTGRAMNAMEKGKPLYTMDEVRQRASRQYTEVDNAGITIKPKSALDMVSTIRQNLDDANMIPGSKEAIEVEKSLAQMEKIIGTQKVPFSTLDRLRQMANDLKGSKDAKEARLGAIAVNTIDDYITKLNGKDVIAGKEGVDAAVKKISEARKDWRNASRAQILEDALNVAEMKALDPKASEGDLIRRGFINIAANKQKMGLFTPEEQNVIKAVANGGSADSLLTFFGQFNPFRSKLAAAGSAAFATQAPVTAGLVAGGGLAADTLQGVLRRRAAEAAVKTIASGAAKPNQPNYAYRGLLTTGLVRPDTNQ